MCGVCFSCCFLFVYQKLRSSYHFISLHSSHVISYEWEFFISFSSFYYCCAFVCGQRKHHNFVAFRFWIRNYLTLLLSLMTFNLREMNMTDHEMLLLPQQNVFHLDIFSFEHFFCRSGTAKMKWKCLMFTRIV